MTLIHLPQQERSKDTQEKLLTALDELLKDNFFEQISIRDISKKAGVSPGTVYRRFKNKEALLPVLYQRFDGKLCEWAGSIWDEKALLENDCLRSRVEKVIVEHVEFYKIHAHILRTLYLYIRLNGELALPDLETRRQSIYEVILNPVLELQGVETASQENYQTLRFIILVLITTLNERFLFPNYRPSKMLMLSEDVFVEELTEAVVCRLR